MQNRCSCETLIRTGCHETIAYTGYFIRSCQLINRIIEKISSDYDSMILIPSYQYTNLEMAKEMRQQMQTHLADDEDDDDDDDHHIQ